jgi:RNA polymerase sigma factor (sigma-70 family)
MLTAEHEKRLIVLAQSGDEPARNRIWEAFYQHALREARRLAPRKGIDRSDAESDGVAVIPSAIDSFDPDRGTRFSTHLRNSIRGALTDLARQTDQSRVFHVSRFQPQKLQPPRKPIGMPPSRFWSEKVLEWVRRVRRPNDRKIIKGLWFDSPALKQADISRRLGVSRSAVSQRRLYLMQKIRMIDRNAIFDPRVMGESLNTFDGFDI